MAMTLVSTVTVGSGGATSIEFTGIPQTGKDLLVLISWRGSENLALSMEINGSTANRTWRNLRGNGASVVSENSNTTRISWVNTDFDTASTFSNVQTYIANYTSAANKSFSSDGVSEANATTAYQTIYAHQWANTAAITSLKFLPDSGTVSQHSTASLYIIS